MEYNTKLKPSLLYVIKYILSKVSTRNTADLGIFYKLLYV